MKTLSDMMPKFKVAPVKHIHSIHIKAKSPRGGRIFVRGCPECDAERLAKHGPNKILPRYPGHRRQNVGCPACMGENV